MDFTIKRGELDILGSNGNCLLEELEQKVRHMSENIKFKGTLTEGGVTIEFEMGNDVIKVKLGG